MTDLDPSWVLHTRNYRETSLLVDVFGLHGGRYRLIAKGARRGKRNQRALLQPFRGLLMTTRGRGELRTLAAVEDSGASHELQQERLACGLYLNELLLALLPRFEPAPDVFALYGHVVAGLAAQTPPAPSLRAFELTLLETLGLAPDFTVVTRTGEAIHEDGCYAFDAGGIGVAPQGVNCLSVPGSALLALAERDFDTEPRAQRQVLAALLQGPLGSRELRSRQLLAQFRELASRTGPRMAAPEQTYNHEPDTSEERDQ